MLPGSFVRVFFPTQEAPQRPGLLHIGYVLVSTASEAVLAYTTSKPWPPRMPLPAGSRFFDTAQAALLNQPRAFAMRLDILARVPLAKTRRPDIDRPGHGAIAMAPPRMQEELASMATDLVRRRRELLHIRGI